MAHPRGLFRHGHFGAGNNRALGIQDSALDACSELCIGGDGEEREQNRKQDFQTHSFTSRSMRGAFEKSIQ